MHALRIDRCEAARKKVRLLLIVAFQTDVVTWFYQALKDFHDCFAWNYAAADIRLRTLQARAFALAALVPSMGLRTGIAHSACTFTAITKGVTLIASLDASRSKSAACIPV